MLTLELDLIQTLSVAALVYLAGMTLRKRIAILDRLNIPSAVVGGLIFATLVLIARDRVLNLTFTTSAQQLFNVAFFTTIGMSASLALLRSGGIQVFIFLLFATVFCFVQNFLGMFISNLFGVNPLLGVIAGSVTLVGGPATGMAFAPIFSNAGVVGADTLALAAATFGIVCGGIVGGPVGTHLIKTYHLHSSSRSKAALREEISSPVSELVIDTEREDSPLISNLIVLGIVMGIGSIVSRYIQSAGYILPAYIGAMAVASIFRNIDDFTGIFKIDPKAMEFIGNTALNIFLVVALMDLKLWQLVQLAIPLFTILVAQVVVIAVFAFTASYRVMGKDYDSAVMASGFIGFALGTTANAMANMRALVSKFGPAPRAFLIVPLVGAFFIDFANSWIILVFLNWLS
jgi:ESS family glutamate:Na+ symporter